MEAYFHNRGEQVSMPQNQPDKDEFLRNELTGAGSAGKIIWTSVFCSSSSSLSG